MYIPPTDDLTPPVIRLDAPVAVLPEDWADQIATTARMVAMPMADGGYAPGVERRLSCRMIRDLLPWLERFYREVVPPVVSVTLGLPVVAMGQREGDSCALSYLDGPGGGSDWEVDPEPSLTALLCVSTLPASAGGELLTSDVADLERIAFETRHVREHRIAAGELIVYDGTRTPHALAPVRGDHARVLVVMRLVAVRDRPRIDQR